MAPKKAYQDQPAGPNTHSRDLSSSPSAAGDIPGSSQHTSRRSTGRSTKSRRSYRDDATHPTHATDPSAPYNQPPPDEMSRRESTSTMRTSSIPLDGPVTYTPTTHRVSKAKKGKRVHACEFPGCGKVCAMTSYSSFLSSAPFVLFILPTCASQLSSVTNCYPGLHQSRTQAETRG